MLIPNTCVATIEKKKKKKKKTKKYTYIKYAATKSMNLKAKQQTLKCKIRLNSPYALM